MIGFRNSCRDIISAEGSADEVTHLNAEENKRDQATSSWSLLRMTYAFTVPVGHTIRAESPDSNRVVDVHLYVG